mgnify:CR=1 FL=1
MIRLEVKEYCSECCDFEADVTKPERQTARVFDMKQGDWVLATGGQTDTIVRCKYAKRCEAIKRYLSQQKGDNEC